MSASTPKKPRKHREPWLAIREELTGHRRLLLTVFSFVLPLGLWCLISYVPWIWHPDVRLQISGDQDNLTTVFTPGDHMNRAYFAEFADAIRDENQQVLSARETGEPLTVSKRENRGRLRHLAPLAISEGWLTDDQADDDAAIYQVWRGLAQGDLVTDALSEENLAVIRRNWDLLAKHAETYSYSSLPETALLELVPQGRLSNPDYVPAPHEVLIRGWTDFTTPPENNQPWMHERLWQSLQVVFGGFLLAAAIGVPLGVLCGTYDFFSKLFEPFIDFFRYMPAPAFSTLLVAVFLAHDAPKIALVFVGTFFQLVLVVSKTTRLLDRSLLEAAQTLGATNTKLLRKVILPGILPNMYNDLRILLGWAWTWLVIAELIGVKSGLTEFIETQGRWRNFDRVFPIIIMIGLLGFFTDQILQVGARFLFPWEYDRKRGWMTNGLILLKDGAARVLRPGLSRDRDRDRESETEAKVGAPDVAAS